MSSSSQLLARTSHRLKQLITSSSQSSSKKSTNHDSHEAPTPSPNSGTPPHPRRTSRPHSWISHTSARKTETSHSPTATSKNIDAAINAESPPPRIEPPAIPKAVKARTKSAGCVATHSGNEHGKGNGDGHGILFSRSESSLCCASGAVAPDCNGKHGCGHGCSQGCESDCSLSGRDASASTPTSRDVACKLPVPRKSSRRKKTQTPSSTPVLDRFPLPLGGLSSSDRKAGRANTGRAPQLSTLDLFEALDLDPDEGLETPTQPGRIDQKHRIEVEEPTSDSTDEYSLPLSRTAWSDDVEQLIRDTDKAFKAVSFALSDAKEATNSSRPINWRQSDSGPESPRKESSMRMSGKRAAKTPLTRNDSIKAAKPKRKKSTKGRKMALQAFPNTSQNQAPRWSLPESVFGGRMFGRLEADEMLKSEESIQMARWSRESLMNEKMEEAGYSRKRESHLSRSTVDSEETSEEDRSTPVEPFHLEELSLRLSIVKVADEDADLKTPRPSPNPPAPASATTNGPNEYFNSRLSSSRYKAHTSHRLPPIPPYSPISPPTPGTLAVFNATALLSPVSAISPPLNNIFHDNGTTDQDAFRYWKLNFAAPSLSSKPSQPQPIPEQATHRSSRSRSVTRTSLATIRETSPIDINERMVSSSMPATPAKNRSPLRSPPKSGTTSATISPMSSGKGTPANGVNANGRGGTTLLHSALHNRGIKQRSNTMPIPQTINPSIANAEIVSLSLSPRKVTPFPGNYSNNSEKIQTTTLTTNGLVSTPFSLTAPLFRHGSIRLNHSKNSKSFPSSGTSTGFATPYNGHSMAGSDCLEALVAPFDWTAFQMAISGGAGDYLAGDYQMSSADIDKEEREEREREIEREREEIYDWWRSFGFRGRDRGMGRVARSEPRKARKKQEHGKKGHSKGEEEKKRRKNKTPQIMVAELDANSPKRAESAPEAKPADYFRPEPVARLGDSLKRPEPVARPFSFQAGQETLTSSRDHYNSCSFSDGKSHIPSQARGSRLPDYDSDESDGLDSPMEPLSQEELRAGRLPMGWNLDHEITSLLRWESFTAGKVMCDRRVEGVEREMVDRMNTV